MQISLDTEAGTATIDGREAPLWSRDAFDALLPVWTKLGWQQKYSYRFSWFGRPVIQLPEDLIRIQELIYAEQPDVIVETGIAHGGSIVFYASLCKAMGKGRVIGIDIEIRPHNREALDAHELGGHFELVEGSSTDPQIVEQVTASVGDAEKVLVLLDSNHTQEHVAAELAAYAPLVRPGGWLIVADGIMRDVHDVPHAGEGWDIDNPLTAAAEFLDAHPEFERAAAPLPFDESEVGGEPTYWPDGWLRRTS